MTDTIIFVGTPGADVLKLEKGFGKAEFRGYHSDQDSIEYKDPASSGSSYRIGTDKLNETGTWEGDVITQNLASGDVLTVIDTDSAINTLHIYTNIPLSDIGIKGPPKGRRNAAPCHLQVQSARVSMAIFPGI